MATTKSKTSIWHVVAGLGMAGIGVGAILWASRDEVKTIAKPKPLPDGKRDFTAEASYALQGFVNKSIEQIKDLRGEA